jgi:ubiquinol-cytochrome c reductase cytochrome c subunit
MNALVLAVILAGRALYMMHCASCHGEVGQGSNVAPALVGYSAADIHLMLDTGRMPASVPYVDEIHQEPVFTQPQMTAITDYVLSFTSHARRALPLVLPGNVEHGRALFMENCAACHGPTGGGASVGSNDVAPSLANATVFQVAEAIRAGPGIMPAFGRDLLSDRDVDDIAHYVNAMQTQTDGAADANAGGATLAHVGPVAEGFIAWFFGVGALVLFVRRIGTTR